MEKKEKNILLFLFAVVILNFDTYTSISKHCKSITLRFAWIYEKMAIFVSSTILPALFRNHVSSSLGCWLITFKKNPGPMLFSGFDQKTTLLMVGKLAPGRKMTW